MYTLYCDRCGYYEERDYIITTKCPNCGHPLIIDNENEDEVTDMINDGKTYIPKKENTYDSQCLENMKRSIKNIGHKATWQIIEDMENPINRLYYRKIFMKAGGQYENI